MDALNHGYITHRREMRECKSARSRRLEVEPCTEHQTLASELYYRLPRELRNRVYTFCVQGSYDNEVIVRRAPGRKNSFALLIRESSGLHSYQWVEDPIASYVSSKHLGLDVAREMLESYYWTHTFKFSHHELGLLRAFLETDRFGLGMTPVNYARRLQLQIQPFASALLRVPERWQFEEERCCRALEALVAIQTARTEVVVQVDLPHGSMDDVGYERISDDADRFLLKIMQLVEGLKERGLRIEIRFSETWDER